MDQWFTENLVCPRDYSELQLNADKLICSDDHVYPIIDGIPVMLLNEVEPTHPSIETTLEKGRLVAWLDSVLASEQGGAGIESREINPYVQRSIVNSCGNLYLPLHNKLTRYPIPVLRLPRGTGESFLDIGSNWGRWSVAAAHKGYSVVGIDPAIEAIIAAKKVSEQLGVSPRFVVADARHLPFRSHSFDIVFSYGVLQHFSKPNVAVTLSAIARVLKPEGTSLIQMPNVYGVRCILQQLRKRLREERQFEVRWWKPSEIKETFSTTIGETALSVDGYFGLGVQKSDADLLPFRYRMIVSLSEFLRRMSTKARWMHHFADSLYVTSRRNAIS